MAALEDLGFYCVDNLPLAADRPVPRPLRQGLSRRSRRSRSPSTRGRRPSSSACPSGRRAAARQGAEVDVLFLDCADEVLVRPLPRDAARAPALAGRLGRGGHRRASGACSTTSSRLADLRLDTSLLNVHQLQGRGRPARLGRGAADGREPDLLRLPLRHAAGGGAALRRALPAESLFRRDRCAREAGSRTPRWPSYVLESARGGGASSSGCATSLAFLLPLYDAEGKAYLTIGIGCTGRPPPLGGGREALAERLRASGREVEREPSGRGEERDESRRRDRDPLPAGRGVPAGAAPDRAGCAALRGGLDRAEAVRRGDARRRSRRALRTGGRGARRADPDRHVRRHAVEHRASPSSTSTRSRS